MSKVLRFFISALPWCLVMEIFLGADAFDFKIVGGYWPKENTLAKYVVSIRLGRQRKYFGDNHICGGQIVSKRAILTAAHCLVNEYGRSRHASSLTIVAGTIHRLVVVPSMQLASVAKIVLHPDFDQRYFIADLGLLILKDALQENGLTVQRLPLNDKMPAVGWNCTALGWGRVIFDGPLPDRLLAVDLSITANSECQKYSELHETEFCAGDVTGSGRDSCDGDSGGPLICNGEKSTGIVSRGLDCGLPNISGVYTNVYLYRDWIFANRAAQKIASEIVFILAFSNFCVC